MSEMVSSQFVENFFDAVGTIAQSKVEKTAKDITIDAEIFAILNVENGEYRVKYQGNIFNTYCFDPTIAFNVGDRVYVLVPQGDFNNKKVILGHSEYKNSGYKDNVASKNFYIDKGTNWLDEYAINEPLAICACPSVLEEKLLDESGLKRESSYFDFGFVEGRVPQDVIKKHPARNYPIFSDMSERERLRDIDKDIERQAANYKFIKVQADFHTELKGPHEEGEYALQVTCLQRNPAYKGSYDDIGLNAYEWLNYSDYLLAVQKKASIKSEEQVEDNPPPVLPYIPVTYELNFSNFSGSSPYSFSSWATQKAYFNIEDAGIVGLYSIALVQNGEFKSDIYWINNPDGTGGYDESTAEFAKNNIFCQNIQIFFCEQVNLYDKLYYPWISLPYGDALYAENAVGRSCEKVELVPHFQYRQLDLTENENCRVVWFRQKADVMASSYKEGYKDEYGHSWFDYGGPGWEPIQKIIDETFEEEQVYKIDGNKLIVYIDAVPVSYYYKAVMVYYESISGQKTSGVKEISRGEITQKIVRRDSKYNLELEEFTHNGTRYLRIKDNNKETGGVEEWLRLQDRLAIAEEKLLKANYDSNTEEIAVAKMEITLIKNQIILLNHNEWRGTWFIKLQDDSYNQISTIQQEGPLDISMYCQDACEFYVMCYDPDELTSYDAQEVAVLEYFILPPERSDMVIEWTGQSDFNYDAMGGLRNDVSSKEYVITPTLKFAKRAGAHYGMKIISPDGVTELTGAYFNQDYGTTGHNLGTSMMRDMYIDNNYGIHFHLKPTYDPSAIDNTFTVIVTLVNGKSFSVTKTVLFSKDGDQGTIGNEWKAQILPTNWRADSKEGLFTKSIINNPSPLVIHPRDGTSPDEEDYVQNPYYRLFLRPFVTRNGIPLESMDKQEAYFYKCSWDVRLPSAATIEPTQRSSFLRLHHASRYDPTTDTPTPGAVFDCTSSNYYEMDGMTVGNGDSDIKVNPLESNTSKKGLVGFTMYPSSPYKSKDPWFADEDNECYGAVEVRYFNNKKDGTHTTMEMNQYYFVVKCQIDVFQGNYDLARKEIITEGYIKRVASIISYYPVDLFVNNDRLDVVTGDFANFEQRIATNWPNFIYYSASGDDPETMTDNLYFKYGGFLINESKNYPPKNLSGWTQSIEETPIYKDKEIVGYNWKYRPNPHLDPVAGYHGALITDPADSPFKSGYYLRNQVMITNLYGNVDINAWDGQGIDTNDKEGTIFGASFGAGYKNPVNNRFTGVLMGADKAQKRKEITGNRTGYNSEEDDYRPYMTGVFGYQDGHQSFGLMENGTAFFGRADRGGRIVLDGSNGLIYGGANGIIESPSIEDPLWNTMRLNLIDLTHATTDPTKDANTWYTHDPENQQVDSEGNLIGPTYIGVKNGNQGMMNLGFNGQFYEYHRNEMAFKNLPDWYQIVWNNAYIKPDGALPYWLQEVDDPTYPGGKRKLVAGSWHFAGDKKEDGTEYASDGFVEGEGDVGIWNGVAPPNEGQNGKNYRAGYFSQQWITLPDPDNPSQERAYTWKQIKADTTNRLLHAYQDKLDSGETISRSNFGPSRASTTPAIEIGQHMHGLMPGLIPYNEYEKVFTSLAIPGDRNFMVTYDGTLWAMNGVFMGAVIGSNVVGGRIQGAELGLGDPTSVDETDERQELYTLWGKASKFFCDWEILDPPTDGQSKVRDIPVFSSGRAFNVDNDGNVGANSIIITGGSIDIGSFHIIGRQTIEQMQALGLLDINSSYSEQLGHLVQTGKSDFIGVTHFYGNVGIGPSLHSGPRLQPNNCGSLTQTGGITILGGILDGSNTINHKFINDFAFHQATQYYSSNSQSAINNIGQGQSVEQSAVFAINAQHGLRSSNGVQSHLWPLHFRSYLNGKVINSYVTVMNQFKNWETLMPKSGHGYFPLTQQGTNYFRISPWGSEAMSIFIRTSFQDEQKNEAPDYDTGNLETYRGYIGSVSRAGYGLPRPGEEKVIGKLPDLKGAIGITSWNQNAIIFKSDDNLACRSKMTNYIVGGFMGETDKGVNVTFTEAGEADKDNLYGGYLSVGGSPVSAGLPEGNNCGGLILGRTYDGNILFMNHKGRSEQTGGYSGGADATTLSAHNGLMMQARSTKTGISNIVWLFSEGSDYMAGDVKYSGVHIFCKEPADTTGSSCYWSRFPEVYVGPETTMVSGNKTVGMQVFEGDAGTEGHKVGKKGIYITENKVKIIGFEPEFQEGIYARFG